MRLIPPIRFRLCEDDHAEYGGQWCVYDESALMRTPVRDLIAFEREIGMSVRTMIGRSRAGYADAELAQTWIARRLAGESRPFTEWNPIVLLIDWEPLPGDDADPPAPTSSPTPGGE